MLKTVPIGRSRSYLWVVPVAIVVLAGCGSQGQALVAPSAVASTAPLLSSDEGGEDGDGRLETLGRGNGGVNNGRGGGDGDRPGAHDGDRPGAHDGDDRPGRGRGREDRRGPGRGHHDDGDVRHPPRPRHRDDARVVGFVAARETGTLIVNGITVAVTAHTRIRHGHRRLTPADIAAGDHVQARGTIEDGVLVAAEIKVQDTGHDNDDLEPPPSSTT